MKQSQNPSPHMCERVPGTIPRTLVLICVSVVSVSIVSVSVSVSVGCYDTVTSSTNLHIIKLLHFKLS